MQDMGIQIRNLRKAYGGKTALKDLSLTIPPGMFGLLGRNGAGKTTLMRTIATLLPFQAGEIEVCGVPTSRAAEVRGLIGYLPQDFSLYGNMRVWEALDYLGILSGMRTAERRRRIALLLDQVNLRQQRRKRVRSLSGGMRQRLGIAQALLHDPRVLIVDEPTAGLDPEERVRFRNLLCEVAQDKTVLLSTHIVADVEAVCEEIAVLDEGELRFRGTVSELRNLARGAVFSAEIAQRDLQGMRSAYPIIAVAPQGTRCHVRFLSLDRAPDIGTPVEPSAEDAYIHCLQGGMRHAV